MSEEGSYMTFRRFITPGFITVIWILGALLVTILGLLMISMGVSAPSYYGFSFGGMYTMMGIIFLIFGNLFWRIACEQWVVIFRIHEALVSIDRKLASQSAREPQRYPPPP